MIVSWNYSTLKMNIDLTINQAIWIRRMPLLSVLIGLPLTPVVALAWYGNWSELLGLLACYAMVGILWLIPFAVEWYGKSNELSTKQKAIKAQQLEDADEWNLIYKQYCRDIGQPNRPQPHRTAAQKQRDADEAWKRTYRRYV